MSKSGPPVRPITQRRHARIRALRDEGLTPFQIMHRLQVGEYSVRRALEPAPQDAERRWSAKRRAAAIAPVLAGETTSADLSARIGVPVEEIQLWVDRFTRYGLRALRATAIQEIRELERQSSVDGAT